MPVQGNMSLVQIAAELASAVDQLGFAPPVSHVYNPLRYAWQPHEAYLRRFDAAPKEAVFLGMNPGPWGMAQTGVPFGEVAAVRDWLGISGQVFRPPSEHPRRPIHGFACTRSEVSGRRVWGWVRSTFGTPQAFFARFFVANYCPLMFLEDGGRNRTPDHLPAGEREPLLEACDRALRQTVDHLRPALVIGVGSFAQARAEAALVESGVRVARILHPSPASPVANRGWAEHVTARLIELEIELPKSPSRS